MSHKHCITLLVILVFSVASISQSSFIHAGPMLGQVELRTAKIWVEVIPGSSVQLWYWKKGNINGAMNIVHVTNKNAWFAPVVFDLVSLEINTTYEYQITQQAKNVKPVKADGEFTTKELWQYRKPVPDFTFLAGSCAYFNEPVFDRPGMPYGKDSSIFITMAKEKAAFMVWLGDNWYLREVDYFSDWGMWYRPHRDRNLTVLQPFLKAMPHFAIWDDHDFGSNDADKSFPLKATSREVFTSYWANPSYGENGEGIYTKMSYGDVDFFMMDDRTYRTTDAMMAFIDGKPNITKRMWGEKQMDWLKNALKNSKATFKVIITGSQTLNTASPADCLQTYPVEFEEFMTFIKEEKIGGLLFITGDRHHSEVVKYERTGNYALYDITSSPLTAGVSRVGGKEKDNPARISGTLVEEQNYARMTVSGKPNERVFSVTFLGISGQQLAHWNISENELRSK